jgi:hypothetical protein
MARKFRKLEDKDEPGVTRLGRQARQKDSA